MKPADIEALSFSIIDTEAGEHGFAPDQWSIVRRIVHTTADFDYIASVRFHPAAVQAGIAAIRAGTPIVTDTRMAEAGIRKQALSRFGNPVACFIADPAVAEKAASGGITRARAALDVAADAYPDGIYAVGNAPTALLRILENVRAGRMSPALVIGFPVGFVNAAESKAALEETDVVFITNRGRKGGSNVAAAVVNALAILAGEGGPAS